MGAKKNETQRFTVNEAGKIQDTFVNSEGHTFKYGLNVRKTGFYALTGTLSLIDPGTRKTLMVYNSEEGKQCPASESLHVRHPKDGEDIQDLIDVELREVAGKLSNCYREQFAEARQNGKLLSEMTFREAELAFLKEAKADFSKTSNMQDRFSASVRTFSKALPDKKIGDIKKSKVLKDIVAHMSDGGKQRLQHLERFIEFIEGKQQFSSGLLPIISEAIGSIRGKDSAAKNVREAKAASNSNVLSNRAEEEFNRRMMANKCDAQYVVLALVKGTYLLPKELCVLKVGQVQRCSNSNEIVFISIKKTYVSATQDYTFPVFPFEAVLLNEYINNLRETYGEERLTNDKYLFSSDDGTTPMKGDLITQLCKVELQRLRFGYADLLGKVDIQKDKGIKLLQETYRHRLEKYCGLKRDNDEGAYLFMLHQSLGNKVQADHYRGFTGESGRVFLLNIVMQDRRFIEEKDVKRQKKEETYRTVGDRCHYTLRKKDSINVHQATIEVELRENETASFEAEHGCVVSVEEVELLK